VSLLSLDVVVTDAAGDAVHGLKMEDFEVLHGGKPVTLSNFHEVVGSGGGVSAVPPAVVGTPAVPVAAAPVPRPRRRLVLFFDRLQISDPERRSELFDSLHRLLTESLEPPDEAMIVTWNRSIQTVAPFTSDLEKLEVSLEQIERQSGRTATETGELELIRSDQLWWDILVADPMVGLSAAGQKPSGELAAQQALFEMKAKTAALKGLSATLGGMEGRKILVFVSHRFSRYAGMEFLLPKRATAEDAAALLIKEFDTKPLLDEVARAANANGVTLYSLFPAGMDEPLVSAADHLADNPGVRGDPLGGRERFALQNEMEALSFVADKTGGVAAVGGGNVAKFVDRVSSDLDSWYSLGYLSPGNVGNSVPVKVRVKGRKLNVRVRGSQIEKTPEEQMRDRVLAHLFRPDERARIPITVAAKVSPSAKDRFRIALEIQIPIASLVLLPTAKGESGTISVFVASVSPKGDFSEVNRQRRLFDIPAADLETAKTGHYTYTLDVETAAPEARVCVGVWDEIGNEAGFRVVRASGPATAPPGG
jgi:VWFA-related protein